MESTRCALIVANDSFADPALRRLRAPAQDAEALAEVLHDPAIGDFEVGTVLNRPAHEVDRAVEAFFSDRSPDDLLVLHFSGHGVKDENGDLYFATSDTDLKLLGATAVSADFVNRLMTRTRSRRVVLFLDCCYAGAFEKGFTTRGDTDLHLGERLGGRGRAVITASTAMEYAFEGTELTDVLAPEQPSVFTSAVVEALRTGDADADQDGLIGLEELYEYVYDKVRSVTPSQTPSKWTMGFQGELYLARRSKPVSEPTPLPEELTDALTSPLSRVRAAAVDELGRFVHASHGGRALAARQALEELVDDDSRSVAAAAAALLAEAPAPAPPTIPLSRTSADSETVSPPPRTETATPGVDAEPGAPSLPEARSPAEVILPVESPPVVSPPVEPPIAPGAPPADSAAPRPRVSRRIIAAAVAALVVIAGGGVWWALAGPSGAATVPSASIVVAVGDGDPVRGALVEVDTATGEVSAIGEMTDARLPTISPDRESIAYLTGPNEQPVPRLVGADGGGDEPFFTDASGCTSSDRPAWSPNGEQVVVVCDGQDGDPARLLLLDADRTLVRELPTEGEPWGSPTWLETSEGLVVVFIEATTRALWRLDPTQPDETLVQVSSGPGDSRPDGAPDGLLFLRKSEPSPGEGTAVVSTGEGVGVGERELTALGQVEAPAWSPDAQSIAFVQDGSLWVASADETGQPHQLDVGGTPGAPAWGSR